MQHGKCVCTRVRVVGVWKCMWETSLLFPAADPNMKQPIRDLYLIAGWLILTTHPHTLPKTSTVVRPRTGTLTLNVYAHSYTHEDSQRKVPCCSWIILSLTLGSNVLLLWYQQQHTLTTKPCTRCNHENVYREMPVSSLFSPACPLSLSLSLSLFNEYSFSLQALKLLSIPPLCPKSSLSPLLPCSIFLSISFPVCFSLPLPGCQRVSDQ